MKQLLSGQEKILIQIHYSKIKSLIHKKNQMKHKFKIGDIDIKTRLNTMQEIDKMSY